MDEQAVESQLPSRIVFAGDKGEDLADIVFDDDDLPKVDLLQLDRVETSYLTSFREALSCARETGLVDTLSKIHNRALGDVNWQRTIATWEGPRFAKECGYLSGVLRTEIPTQLTIASAENALVYYPPVGKPIADFLSQLEAMFDCRIKLLDRASPEYFKLAAEVSLMVFLTHPFVGGNKRTIRPLTNYILTRGGLTGRWLEGDGVFKKSFKEAWVGLARKFQQETNIESPADSQDYSRVWYDYWLQKLRDGEIGNSTEVEILAEAIRQAPYYDYALMQKVKSSDD
ncbi:MAG: hypothetical protein ABID04_03725 [Patescibacteria group bacterium]